MDRNRIAKDFSHAWRADPSLCCGYFYFNTMDRIEIIEALELLHGTSEPSEVPLSDRYRLLEDMKWSVRQSLATADDYTRQVILIMETLEL